MAHSDLAASEEGGRYVLILVCVARAHVDVPDITSLNNVIKCLHLYIHSVSCVTTHERVTQSPRLAWYSRSGGLQDNNRDRKRTLNERTLQNISNVVELQGRQTRPHRVEGVLYCCNKVGHQSHDPGIEPPGAPSDSVRASS